MPSTLEQDIQMALLLDLQPWPLVSVRGYYEDPDGNRHDKDKLENYWGSVLALAVSGMCAGNSDHLRRSQDLLDAWCKTNIWPGHDEKQDSALYFVFKGQMLIEAATIIRRYNPLWDDEMFVSWLYGCYIPACKSLCSHFNNWGIWGRYGVMRACVYLGDKTSADIAFDDALAHMTAAFKRWPLLSRQNEVWTENLRSTSGMEYTQFYLVVCLGVMRFYPEIGDFLLPRMQKFFSYCIDPGSWPYKGWTWPLRLLQKWWFPCDDKISTPTPNNWGGTLMYCTGKMFMIDSFTQWASQQPSNNVNMFRYARELFEAGYYK